MNELGGYRRSVELNRVYVVDTQRHRTTHDTERWITVARRTEDTRSRKSHRAESATIDGDRTQLSLHGTSFGIDFAEALHRRLVTEDR
jgi:hypothetical protein